jgi:hypothetical protein
MQTTTETPAAQGFGFCPLCKQPITHVQPSPLNPLRLQGFCACNPLGPVKEFTAPAKAIKKKGVS